MNYIAYITLALMLFYIKVKESPSTEIRTAYNKNDEHVTNSVPFSAYFFKALF